MKAPDTKNDQPAVAANPLQPAVAPLQKSDGTRANPLVLDVLCFVALLVIIGIVFFQAIFKGGDVSKFYCIAEWDSLFDAARRGAGMKGDPSAVLMYVPTYMYIAKILHSGALPLWNSLSTFGSPLIGDIQSTVVSPFRLLFDCFPSLRVYNLSILANVALACLGTFVFARALGVGRLSATFAALAYGLCPYFLWYAELWGVGYALNPVVASAFLLAARKPGAWTSMVAGIAAGITVISSHPEHSFFVIAFSTLLMFCLAPLRQAVLALSIAGGTALCIAAPAFFPFVEFLKNSDCYKFALSQASIIPWQAFAFDAASPGFAAASPFLGVLLLPLSLFAFAERDERRNMWASLITLTAALCVASEVWPLSALAKHPPFIYVMTTYATPIVLLYASVFASFGVNNVQRLLNSSLKSPFFLAAAALLVAVVSVPPLLAHSNLSVGNFDMTLPDMAFSNSAWKTGLWCAFASIGVLCASFFWKKLRGITALALVILNFASVLPVMKKSLPVTRPFELPQSEVMSFLANSGERCLAIGTHLCKPDANLLYGVDDIRSINPMFPKRYINFINACGVSAAEFSPVFKDNLTPVLDLASVRFVISNSPVSCSEDPAPNIVPIANGRTVIAAGVTLDSVRIWASPSEHGAGGFVHFQNAPKDGNLTFMLVLLDPSNTSVWYSDTIPFRSLTDGNYQFTAGLPVQATDMTKFRLGVRVFDPVKVQFLDTEARILGTLQDTHEPPKHFSFFREFNKRFRIYRNAYAFPRAYLVPQATFVDSEEKALQLITGSRFDQYQSAVIEGPAPTATTNPVEVDVMHQSVRLQRTNPNETVVEYDSPFAGYLVLTDSFYPGWNAYVDGKRTPIMHANYMFRGIQAPSGRHRVFFKYEPLSVLLGFTLQLSFLCLCVLLFILREGRKRIKTV